MKAFLAFLAILLMAPALVWAEDEESYVKALVGGTLIDGFSSTPIQDSPLNALR